MSGQTLADISHALTPEATFYTDAAGPARELESVFSRSWQLVGHSTQLAESGDFFTTAVCGENVLAVNDAGVLRAFLNVCRHRAGPIAEGCGRQKLFACRYHGWVYDLKGQLLRAPEMEGVTDFDPARIRLDTVRIERWGPMLFVTLDPQIPGLQEFFPQLAADCAPYGVETMGYVASHTYQVAANWKVYIDNFLEGYHIPLVHPALDRELDYRRWRDDISPASRDAVLSDPRAGCRALSRQSGRSACRLLLAVPQHDAESLSGSVAGKRRHPAWRRSL
jgi:choline monooxygenase